MVTLSDHVILALPDGFSVTKGEDRYDVDATGLRASAVHDGGALQRFNLEAEVVNVSGTTSAAMSGVTGALRRVPDQPAYSVAFNATEFAAAGASGSGSLALEGEAGIAPEAMGGTITIEDLRRIRVGRLDLTQGALALAMAADLDVAEDGEIEGDLTIRADNLSAAIAAEREAGRMPSEVLSLIEGTAQLLSGLSGREDSIDVGLEFRGGRTWLGILPIGPAPDLF